MMCPSARWRVRKAFGGNPMPRARALRNDLDTVARIGALRSRLVSKLSGFTPRQLGYWHTTRLIEAHIDAGARGFPRLYSWIDYMKLREAAKLSAAGVPTARIRRAVDYLEEAITNWYSIPPSRGRPESHGPLERRRAGCS